MCENDGTVESGEVQELEKQFLCPFEGPSADGIRVRHSVRFLDIPHVSVVVLYSVQFQGISMVIA